MRTRTKILDAAGQRLLAEVWGDDPHVVIRCRRCGRILKSERAQVVGIGRACRKREAEENGSVNHQAGAACGGENIGPKTEGV